MIHLFTVCVDIGRHSKSELVRVMNILINSLEKTNKYHLHVFTNFSFFLNNSNITVEPYFGISEIDIYSDKWLNLSFNKIHIYKYLLNKYGIDFTWIDLDTIVAANIEYINDLSSVFIDTGGTNKDPHNLIENNTAYMVSRDIWIQGNFWKLNIDLYNRFININTLMNQKNMRFNYDLQSLFTYYFYFILNGYDNDILIKNSITILGKNYKPYLLNGLAVWDKNGDQHANHIGLENLYFQNGLLKSHFYPGKEIHLVSFTFFTLKTIMYSNKFIELFGSNNNIISLEDDN